MRSLLSKVVLIAFLSLAGVGVVVAVLIVPRGTRQVEWAQLSDKQKNSIASVAHSFCRAALAEEDLGSRILPIEHTFIMPWPRDKDTPEIDRSYVGVGLLGWPIPAGEQRDRITNSIHKWATRAGGVTGDPKGRQRVLYISDYDVIWSDPNKSDPNAFGNVLLIVAKAIRTKRMPVPASKAEEESHLQLLDAAKSGKPEDLYRLGISYLSDRADSPSDLAEAYYWLSRAASLDSPERALYTEARDTVGAIMTTPQLRKSEALRQERRLSKP